MTGSDVKQLQVFLNEHGFIIAKTGAGSLGQETTEFGQLTKSALIKFQDANFDVILKPQGFKKGTGFFYTYTRNYVNKLCK